MMKWLIPAKTFLLGEYAAIQGHSAMLLTTTPCFEFGLGEKPGSERIHPDAPAMRWWNKTGLQHQAYYWIDPYQGLGGLGASSAQFVGAYCASHALLNQPLCIENIIADYLTCMDHHMGLKPSGYDVLAQMYEQCVYINQNNHQQQVYNWPFSDLNFILLRTGQKLATHEHLKNSTPTTSLEALNPLVHRAKLAFESKNSALLVDAVNQYHQALLQMNLVSTHSLDKIQELKHYSDILAIKGCGAMGADVLLILVKPEKSHHLIESLTQEGWKIIASNNQLYMKN